MKDLLIFFILSLSASRLVTKYLSGFICVRCRSSLVSCPAHLLQPTLLIYYDWLWSSITTGFGRLL